MRLVYVNWVDSRGVHEHWIELDDLESTVCEMHSVGWIHKETEELIHLVPHIGAEPWQGCGDMVIPKVAISKITEIKKIKL